MCSFSVLIGPETFVAPVGEECTGLSHGDTFWGIHVLGKELTGGFFSSFTGGRWEGVEVLSATEDFIVDTGGGGSVSDGN